MEIATQSALTAEVDRVVGHMADAMTAVFPDPAAMIAYVAASPSVQDRIRAERGIKLETDAIFALAKKKGMKNPVSKHFTEWLLTKMTPENLRAAIKGAKDLKSLQGALRLAEAYIVHNNLPDSSCIFTDDDMQTSFGGAEPDLDEDGVWAWDETHVLKWWGVWDLERRKPAEQPLYLNREVFGF